MIAIRLTRFVEKGAWLLLAVALFCGCAGQNQVSRIETPPSVTGKQRTITAIELNQTPETLVVSIVSSSTLTYTSVKQSFPLGVAVYLPETLLADNVLSSPLAGMGQINSIAANYADSEMKTARVDILLNENLDYEVSSQASGLTVVFRKSKTPAIDQRSKVAVSASAPAAETVVPPVFIPKGPARVTGIFFNNAEDGRSEIFVRTSQPVRYDMEKGGRNDLTLKLYDVDIPPHRCRPLVTTYFKSAVERIVPVQRSKGQAASTVAVKMREPVPYHIVQTGEGLFLTFEPSTLEPPTFEPGRSNLASGGGAMPVKASATAEAEASPGPEQDKAPGFPEKKVYTGEKIRLDFFETDIKNVFRILRSVSGKNFAVDRDVTGSVTMTLDKPVPWDQVLDLVLKMNHLGQIQEGTIVRIATLATLAQEQKQDQDALTAHKATLEQRKSLEPLETEYIPINYSSAEADVKPHLEKILTPDRGILSVDSRTNMIILTDVREKIDQAKELIHRLDKVTPQIMISARVVEVNKNFSKSLGINWGASSADVYRDDLGGSYGFNVAMNYPVASQGSLGFDFSRISGTPLELNATLSASEIKGDVKIISSPKILTLDNKKAKIKQGLEYAYLERDDSGGSSVKFKNIDLLLEVTPHVTPDHRIAMSVLITKNDLASVVDGVPSLSTNEAETELLVNDGNTIVIGGIVKNTSSASENGFPGLSNVPILGGLFGSDSTEDKKNELLIFITPTIVQLEQINN